MTEPTETDSRLLDKVDVARLSAQAHGRPTASEMVAHLDALLYERLSSMRARLQAYGDDVDWAAWGRRSYVLEQIVLFLQRPEIEALVRRMSG